MPAFWKNFDLSRRIFLLILSFLIGAGLQIFFGIKIFYLGWIAIGVVLFDFVDIFSGFIIKELKLKNIFSLVLDDVIFLIGLGTALYLFS